MEDRERDDETSDAIRWSERLLRPLAEDDATPPGDLVERVGRRTRAWCLLRDSLGLVTGAYRRFFLELFLRSGGRHDRER